MAQASSHSRRRPAPPPGSGTLVGAAATILIGARLEAAAGQPATRYRPNGLDSITRPAARMRSTAPMSGRSGSADAGSQTAAPHQGGLTNQCPGGHAAVPSQPGLQWHHRPAHFRLAPNTPPRRQDLPAPTRWGMDGGNWVDVDTGEEYWISGVKKNRHDRRWAGGGTVEIDHDVRDAYYQLVGGTRSRTRRLGRITKRRPGPLPPGPNGTVATGRLNPSSARRYPDAWMWRARTR